MEKEQRISNRQLLKEIAGELWELMKYEVKSSIRSFRFFIYGPNDIVRGFSPLSCIGGGVSEDDPFWKERIEAARKKKEAKKQKRWKEDKSQRISNRQLLKEIAGELWELMKYEVKSSIRSFRFFIYGPNDIVRGFSPLSCIGGGVSEDDPFWKERIEAARKKEEAKKQKGWKEDKSQRVSNRQLLKEIAIDLWETMKCEWWSFIGSIKFTLHGPNDIVKGISPLSCIGGGVSEDDPFWKERIEAARKKEEAKKQKGWKEDKSQRVSNRQLLKEIAIDLWETMKCEWWSFIGSIKFTLHGPNDIVKGISPLSCIGGGVSEDDPFWKERIEAARKKEEAKKQKGWKEDKSQRVSNRQLLKEIAIDLWETMKCEWWSFIGSIKFTLHGPNDIVKGISPLSCIGGGVSEDDPFWKERIEAARKKKEEREKKRKKFKWCSK